jgi:tetratricopeptide (TPR) repeat protein
VGGRSLARLQDVGLHPGHDRPRAADGLLGSGRYDYYRVALDEFRKRPLTGVGYESFQVAYLAQRRTDETPRFPHSLAFGVLSQVGLVGVALLLAFLGQALAMVRRALRDAGEQRLLVAGALAGFTVWFVHGLVDWLWEFPALGVLAFALLGLAMRGCAAAAEPEIPGRPSRRRLLEWPFARRRAIRARALRGAAAIAAVVVALSFATLGIAARHTQAGFEDALRDPAGALTELERASRLDVLSAAPLLTRGVIAQRLGDRRLAETSFRGALAREPRNWFANLELGVLSAATGRRAAALDLLGRAARLNPRETLIARARRRVAGGQTVVPGEIEQALFADQTRRVKSVMP